MRLGLALVAVCACGSVEKIKPDAGKDAPGIDAFVPAVALSMPGPANVDAEGEYSTLTVQVHTAKPHKVVNVAYSGTTDGTISPMLDFVTTDGSGDGSSNVTYLSGSAAGPATASATVIGTTDGMMSAPLTAMLNIVPLERAGFPTPYPTQGSFTVGYLLGEQVTVMTTGHLKRIGFYSAVAGPNIQVGIYTDVSGAPGTLVAQLPGRAVVAGVNEIQISPIPITAGTYWFMAVYDNTGHVGRHGAGMTDTKTDYISFTYNSQLPMTFPAPMSYMGDSFNYYLVVGQ
ncbi:MAG: hypothetical protein JO257_13230 [Deltaproteobacteria bacterium]|nr:hypothetical protein [Deltaproteobacteria bacterium]